jgi:Protein of unknown function (DUF3617)
VRKSLLACLATAAALQAQAAGIGLKPGLWEVHLLKQVVDGRDMSAQIAESTLQMRQALANLPPEQRARVEAMMKQHGMPQNGNGGYRICITPEMAKRDPPVIDRSGRCTRTQVNRSGNRMSFSFSCESDKRTMTGKGMATTSRELVTTEIDATTRSAAGEQHVIHSESEMKYLAADCGDVKPAEGAQ